MIVRAIFCYLSIVLLFACTPNQESVISSKEKDVVKPILRFGKTEVRPFIIEDDDDLTPMILQQLDLPLSCDKELYPAFSIRWKQHIYLPMADFIEAASLLYQRFEVIPLENLKTAFENEPILIDGFLVFRRGDQVVFTPSPDLEGLYPTITFDWGIIAYLLQQPDTEQTVLHARNPRCFHYQSELDE